LTLNTGWTVKKILPRHAGQQEASNRQNDKAEIDAPAQWATLDPVLQLFSNQIDLQRFFHMHK